MGRAKFGALSGNWKLKIEKRKLPLRLEGTQKGSRKKRKLLLRLVERSRMKFGALSGKNENSFSLGSLKNRNCKNNLIIDQQYLMSINWKIWSCGLNKMASWQNGALAWVTWGVHVDIKVPEHYLNPLKKGLVVHFFVHAWKFDDAILIKLNQNCFEITWGVHMCILKVPESFKYTKFDTEKLKFGLEWLGNSKTRLRVLKKAKNGKNVSFFGLLRPEKCFGVSWGHFGVLLEHFGTLLRCFELEKGRKLTH